MAAVVLMLPATAPIASAHMSQTPTVSSITAAAGTVSESGVAAARSVALAAVDQGVWTVLTADTPVSPAISGEAEVEYAENSQDAVASYTATGLAADSTAWTLSGDDAAAFTVSGGELGFVAVPDFEKPSDADAANTYAVTVAATDAAAVSANIEVTVTVTDVYDPSIVLIMADDAGYEVFGAYGSTQYSTPNLDEIADGGVRFDNVHSTPICAPTRIAIMTGKDSVSNYADWGTLLPEEKTFADLFGDAGYATAVAGKWQVWGNKPSVHESSPAGHGFDTYQLWHTGRTDKFIDVFGVSNRYWNPSLEGDDGELIDTGSSDYGPDFHVDFLLRFIESKQRQPFFAYYPMALPHIPFELPPDATCPDADEQCIFEQMISRVDYNVGLIHDRLETLGLLGNTILMFTADNGTPGQIVSSLHGDMIRGNKGTTLDSGTHVPLIAHVPGISDGHVVDDLVSLIDVLPTLADAAGLETPAAWNVDGVSFWEQLQGNVGTPREWIYTYHFPKPYETHITRVAMHPETSWARTEQYKLYASGEMFDVTADPHELNELAAEHTESGDVRADLQAVLNSKPARSPHIYPLLIKLKVQEGEARLRRYPVLRRASVNAAELELHYAGRLGIGGNPSADSFAVLVDGNAVTVTDVVVNRFSVTLTLGTEVAAGQAVTVSYAPGDNAIHHANRPTDSGREAESLSEVSVVNETPPSDAPVITGAADVDFAENGTGAAASFGAVDPQGDEVSWDLAGIDAALFSLSTAGVLAFASPPDFERPADSDADNAYRVVVAASDGELSGSVDVVVSVTDVDEPPVAHDDDASTNEDTPVSIAVLSNDVDPEAFSLAVSVISGPASGAALAHADGTVTYTPSADYYGSDSFVYSVFDGTYTAEATVTVTVASVNDPPIFGTSQHSYIVPGDTPDGSVIGLRIAARDADGDSIVYRLDGEGASYFGIDETTAQIHLLSAVPAPREYAVTVTASDGRGGQSVAEASLIVTNPPDVPAESVDPPDDSVDPPDDSVGPPDDSVDPPSGSGSSSGGGGGGGDFDVGVATFVVANGWSPADVGVASVLAARTAGAVVIYTAGGELSVETAMLLREALPAEVVIVGGTAAVSRDVRSQIRSASPDSGIDRITGADRAATAAGAARHILGVPSDAGRVTVVVANGWSPPDIGAAAALAARSGRSAVIYVQQGSLPESSAAVLRDYEVARVVIVGGTAAVSEDVAARVAATAGADVSRLTGADRIATAALAARRVLGSPAGAPEGITLVVANGWSPPDVGVAAALAAAVDNAAVAYVSRGSLPDATAALIRDYRPARVVIVGGRAAVHDDVRTAIAAAAPDGADTRRVTGQTRTDTAARAARNILRNQ